MSDLILLNTVGVTASRVAPDLVHVCFDILEKHSCLTGRSNKLCLCLSEECFQCHTIKETNGDMEGEKKKKKECDSPTTINVNSKPLFTDFL